ncbi:hypothetical protein CVD25_16090 [Bacillus canaveralius]|uniref:Peptidase M28 domain-containing protein n=1 Tax=Bacillus canaveralius TaxID=1403243 RepID=A0A2N5GQU5_9BACI|nr:M20/M25/M40 family metallo-hydrolase [Bacillus canaveralius]PLR85614.1 hypothetical protein CU635_03955 [Bacillus canaveralius]PLR94725.1 hypothetical protein CVD25_16090 [Bacillus canaveralius]RSK50478.1 M20/M25/M40 family metallo-hydrolase [Bacillus canaveralius]
MKLQNTNHRYRTVAVIVYILVIFSLIMANMWAIPSIEVVSKEDTSGKVSAERVHDHLKKIAQQPRPVGSAYHDQSKEYIADTIRDMNIPVVIEQSTVMHDKKKLPIQNIVATMEGTQPGKQVMVMAHYDSVPEGPGANDDGVNVAVMLEAMRVLKKEEPMRNTMVFLFTDGEELGLYGAKEYLKKHSSEHIGFVINLEARGYKGPVILFQTSGPNGSAIQLFNEYVNNPYAFSFMEDIYRHLPNDTDFTPFKEEDISGLNFAYAEGAHVYHTKEDDLKHVYLPTVQHSGQYVLSMTKALSSMDLSTLGNKENQVFFNVFGDHLVVFPVSWNVFLAAIALLLSATTILYGWRKGDIVLQRSSRWVIFAVAIAILLYLYGSLFSIAYSIYELNGFSSMLLIALTAISILGLLFYWILRKLKVVSRLKKLVQGLPVIDIVVGTMLIMAALTVWTKFSMPGSHYLFAIPLMVSSFSLLGFMLMRQSMTACMFLSLIAAIPLTLILYPVLRLLFVGFGIAGIHYLLIILLLYVPLILPATLYTETKVLGYKSSEIRILGD